MYLPSEDKRSVDELFAIARRADGDHGWNAVCALHWRGSRDVLDRALSLCQSLSETDRELGVDILGQLGVPDRSYPDECFNAAMQLLSDDSHEVLQSAIIALQHIDQVRAMSHVLPFQAHPDGQVRYAVAVALAGVNDEDAVSTLIALTTDPDADVRNWATFGLGRLCDADSSTIREALCSRLNDVDPDVRYEAICGLGLRRDARAIPFLKTMLHEDPLDIFTQEAAASLLGIEETDSLSVTELLGALQRMQRWKGGFSSS